MTNLSTNDEESTIAGDTTSTSQFDANDKTDSHPSGVANEATDLKDDQSDDSVEP